MLEKINKARLSASPKKLNKSKIFDSKILNCEEILDNPKSDQSSSSDNNELIKHESIEDL